jgi:RNA polymerase sigma-70 factor (ECF subfamily)
VDKQSDLLERSRRLDKHALAEVYDEYSPGLYRYAYRLTGNTDQAEECVAEVFTRFLHALSSGGGPRQWLRPYLYRVAHNWITDQFRRQPQLYPLEEEWLASPEAGPALQVHSRLEEAQVRSALRQLTPDQRQVILLKFYENFSNEEVALALDKPVGAVKSLQHRALAALERCLSVEEKSYETI